MKAARRAHARRIVTIRVQTMGGRRSRSGGTSVRGMYSMTSTAIAFTTAKAIGGEISVTPWWQLHCRQWSEAGSERSPSSPGSPTATACVNSVSPPNSSANSCGSQATVMPTRTKNTISMKPASALARRSDASRKGRRLDIVVQHSVRPWCYTISRRAWRRMALRSSGMGIGSKALTCAPPVLPSGTQMRENRNAARMRGP